MPANVKLEIPKIKITVEAELLNDLLNLYGEEGYKLVDNGTAYEFNPSYFKSSRSAYCNLIIDAVKEHKHSEEFNYIYNLDLDKKGEMVVIPYGVKLSGPASRLNAIMINYGRAGIGTDIDRAVDCYNKIYFEEVAGVIEIKKTLTNLTESFGSPETSKE